MVGLLLFVLPGQIETVESLDFSRGVQLAAVTATVRIGNLGKGTQGSGVLIGRKGSFAYVLTANHVIEGAERLEVATFSPASYPQAARIYRSVRVVARAEEMRDLALLRVTTEEALPRVIPFCPARLMPHATGLPALAVGCASGAAPTCVIDQVTGQKLVRRKPEDKAAVFWEVDRKQEGGCSGGPLVDKQGQLLGICSGTDKDKGYYCHLDEVRAFLSANGFEWLP